MPSSKRISLPLFRTSNISGWGSATREASPGSSSRSNRKAWPDIIFVLPFSITPIRSLGPCRSTRTAIGRLNLLSNPRMMANRDLCSACVPWLKFNRKTSAPASNSFEIEPLSFAEGPKVATIFARRFRFIVGL